MMEPGYLNLEDEENLLTQNIQLRQAIGALLYASQQFQDLIKTWQSVYEVTETKNPAKNIGKL